LAEPPRRTIYGRRRGKPLRPARRELLQRLLPRLRLDPSAWRDRALDPRTLFTPARQRTWLEIGFGAGEHLTAMARAHPEVGFIGCEPFINGVARLLGFIDQYQLDNVRIVDGDAALLLDKLPDASIDRAFLLFPDPWPKRRHHKRRFVRPSNIAAMARVLADGARWRMATDDAGYCRWMLAHLADHPEFEWLVRRPSDWRCRPEDWPPTRYEGKALAEGRAPAYLGFQRRSRQVTADAANGLIKGGEAHI
jgi:tRNA (guanine-N7-)-methyltransferase